MKDEICKLVEWIREYVAYAKKDGVVLGLSGGVDSAVVAALSAEALGVDNVRLLSLPCGGDDADVEDADKVAQFLGFGSVKKINLWWALGQMGQCFDIEPANRQPELESAVIANMTARLRMIALYAEAQLHNSLVIGTGNKSELLVGYITKWGDGGVDFEPLGEFYKTEVIEMARELGLPEDVCTRTPSPGLQEGVTDESELGMSYEVLDSVLECIDGDVSSSLLRVQGFNGSKRQYRRAIELVEGSEHKRHMPPSFERCSGD